MARVREECRVKVIAVIVGICLLWAQPVLPEDLPSHPPPEKLGRVSFATSCAASVAHDFERSVALLHSFSYAASEQSFRKVAAADPTCAMAHWGIAMSYYHQLWIPPNTDDVRGEHEIQEARRLSGGASPRERQFIAAAAAYYADPTQTPPLRAKAYL